MQANRYQLIENLSALATGNPEHQPVLLAAKLRMPRLRHNHVPRLRLIDVLNAALAHPLTLVSAPAGSGKTALLAEWAAKCPAPVAWFSLDRADNDPALFWMYFVGALQALKADIGDEALPLLRTSSPNHPERFLTSLLNQLGSLASDRVLILDDYHLIESDSLHGGMTFFIEHLPQEMHLVIASRGNPPLALARMDARGRLAQIPGESLKFAYTETVEFLRRAGVQHLGTPDIEALQTKIDGWVTGLQLVTPFLSSGPAAARFVNGLSGSHRLIADYMMEEVLRPQPLAVQKFLLETCILERLSAPLCAAVLEQETGSAQTMLDSLERANLFVVTLDDNNEWYRCHPFFVELLRGLVASWPAARLAVLHSRASLWYAANGNLVQAINHAMAGKDFERAADLLDRYAGSMVRSTEIAGHLDWFEALPPELVAARPRLCIIRAWTLRGEKRREPIEALLKAADHVLAEQPQDARVERERVHVQNTIQDLRTTAAHRQGKIDRAIELSNLALEQLPADDFTLRSALLNCIASTYELSGEIASATQAVFEALPVARAAGVIIGSVDNINCLGRLRRDQGRLQEAGQLFRHALAHVADAGAQDLPVAGFAHVGLGELLYEWNALDGAMWHLREGLTLLRPAGYLPPYPEDAYIAMAKIKQAEGHGDQALTIVEDGMHRLVEREQPNCKLAAFRARLWSAQDNLAAALVWAHSHSPLDEQQDFRQRDAEQLTCARILVAEGQLDQALEIIVQSRQRAEVSGRTGNAIEMMALQAVTLQAKGDTGAGLEILERAVRHAERGGYVRTFLDEGPILAALLIELQETLLMGPPRPCDASLAAYISGLLTEFGPNAKSNAQATAGPVAEPLSECEIQVARLLCAGRTTREVAEHLHVSENTVRTHVRHVYGKLGVRNRIELMSKARVLRL